MSSGTKVTTVSKLFLAFVAGLIPGILFFINPNLNPTYSGGLMFWAFIVALALIATMPVRIRQGWGNQLVRELDETDVAKRLMMAGGTLAVAILVILATSTSLWRAGSYYHLLGEEQTAEFSTALPPIDLTQAPLVSYDMAQRSGEKKLSEVAGLGSQVRLGTMTKQLVKGKLYWVAMLHHRDVFKWWSEGATPGYVKVSATDASDVELVTHLNGKPLKMTYLTSAYLLQNLERHLWFHGYMATGLTDITPEIDDEGRPFYVLTKYIPKVGFSGEDATGVVVVDVQTGEIAEYSLDKIPAWIDRVQPEAFVKAQVHDRLYYVHGWLNPSDKDRQAISGDIDLVYGADGKAYYYVGITSVAREGGLTSFMLIDTHTKAVRRFVLPGVTEHVAQQAAEGVMPEKKYSATNALPFIVHGEPTYVMALRDGTGLARAYALVNMRDFNVVATGETLQSATRLYQQKLSLDRTQSETQTSVQTQSLELRVGRMSADVRNGTTLYYVMLEGRKDLMLVGNSELSEELVLTHVGDRVKVEFKKGAGAVASLTHFDNLELGTAD